MCNRLSAWLGRVSTGWVALVTLVGFLLFSALVLPRQAASAAGESGGAASPDTSLWYSPAALYRMAEEYGPEGRAAYVRARYTFDVAWPLVYGAFLVTSIGWLTGRTFPPDSLWRRATLVPVLGVLFDFLENMATSLVMARYPARTDPAAWGAPVLTLVKWIFVGGSFVLLVVVFVMAVWRRVRQMLSMNGSQNLPGR
jgi:hypothetical protein